MKVIHLSTYDNMGGAGRAAHRIHRSVALHNVDSQLVVKYAKNVYSNGVRPSVERMEYRLVTNVLRVLGREIIQVIFRKQNRSKKFSSLFLYYSKFPSKFLNRFDVVCLYWVCDGLISPETLSTVRKPIVWRLSDMWPFTGGCHYSGQCTRYTENCGRCPLLGSGISIDPSRLLWNRKSRAWKDINLTIVSPSRWLADCARNSMLFADQRIEIIPTGIDTKVFQPYDKQGARQALGLPSDTSILLFGATGALEDERKGFGYLEKAMKRLNQLGSLPYLVTFGVPRRVQQYQHQFRIHHMGYIDDVQKLGLLYSAADLFVGPSKEENLPNTVIEAMGCGLPCVAFDIGGISDLVIHKQNGFLAQPFDTNELADGIAWILSDSASRHKMGVMARLKIQKDFNLMNIGGRYAELYESVSTPTYNSK